ncbi:hypothetical protein SAMN02745751_03713 [Dethiosulfatibacter aminovorans DSM 17477]|uniref:Pyrrolo-quinoline quinone repeat domain-containing protein n=1 Tax=Dethiosulfatibacter aminovorans DSM 17477 TaxID=1121476 RepID=A0A1M6N8Z0_9FIRM|nr:PQQ-binding-like beta-propeller repeat protein [Dethiosulfatibacter aminovorans]SHJ92152.1 hypothetical protein SAMN02745751_03713 [Dethiosulfatibacter aminovorans DSM 17477]
MKRLLIVSLIFLLVVTGCSGVEEVDIEDEIITDGIEYTVANRQYYIESHEELMYVLYSGVKQDDSDFWCRALWKINPYGEDELLYETVNKNLSFRARSDNSMVAIETDQKLIFMDATGDIIHEFSEDELGIDKGERFSIVEWDNTSGTLWMTAQETYVVMDYITVDTNTWEVMTYHNPLGPTNDYDLDVETGWILSSNYPVFLDFDSKVLYHSGNLLTSLYLYNIFEEEKYFVASGFVNEFKPLLSSDGFITYQVDNQFYHSTVEDVKESGISLDEEDKDDYGIQYYTEGKVYLEDGIIFNLERYGEMDNIVWHRTWNGIQVGTHSTHSKVSVKNKRVYIVIDQSLYTLDYNTGETIWVTENVGASNTEQAPLLDKNGTIYLSSQFEPNLTAINENGEIKWQLSAEELFGIQELTLDGEVLSARVDNETVYNYSLEGKRLDSK